MAKQTIGIGSSANDGTGDTLRDGAVKLNANFDELYQKLGNNSDLQIDIGVGLTDDQVLKWNATNTAFEGGNYDKLTSDLDVNGNYIVTASGGDVIVKPDTTGDIKLWAGNSGQAYVVCDGADGYLKWNAPYTDEASLPDASTYHGMFAHVHGTGKGYFSHGGAWVKPHSDGDSMGELANGIMVNDAAIADGKFLKYDVATDRHVYDSAASSVSTLSDVNISGIQDNSILK